MVPLPAIAVPPSSRNPFAIGRPEALGDEELRDRIAIYRALLERLDEGDTSIIRTKQDVTSALRELEEEAERRH